MIPENIIEVPSLGLKVKFRRPQVQVMHNRSLRTYTAEQLLQEENLPLLIGIIEKNAKAKKVVGIGENEKTLLGNLFEVVEEYTPAADSGEEAPEAPTSKKK